MANKKKPIQQEAHEIVNAYYLYSEQRSYCEYIEEFANGNLAIYVLPLVSELSFQKVFHQTTDNYDIRHDIYLTIENNGRHLEITLSGVKDKIASVSSSQWRENWQEIDWGKMVWNPEIEDYQLQKGLPKSFYMLFEDYEDFEGEDGAIQFCFSFENHLVLKDKDPNKNFIWYQFDYNWEIAQFLHDTLSPYIPPHDDKEVVVIPGEYGEVGDVFNFESNYRTIDYYRFFWPERKKNPYEDIYRENRKSWLEGYEEPQLVISFLPTHEENWKVENKYRLTGTRWFRKLWEIFGKYNVPIVLKCYPGFIHINLLKRFPEIFKKIDNIVELPLQIEGKYTGTGNQLAFFNCPWLKGKKLNFKEYLEKDLAEKTHRVVAELLKGFSKEE